MGQGVAEEAVHLSALTVPAPPAASCRSECGPTSAEEQPAGCNAVPHIAAPVPCSSGGSQATAAAPAATQQQRQPATHGAAQAPASDAGAGQPARLCVIVAGDRLFQFDCAAVRRQAAQPEVHAGAGLDAAATFHNLDGRGRAHSILRPIGAAVRAS